MASKAIDIINKSKLAYGDGDISCKPEAPVEIRAVRSLLLGLCWQVNEWGSLCRKVNRVGIPTSTMTAAGKDVMAVGIENDELKITWLDPTWAEWKELHDSTEMKELIGKGNKKLQQSAESKIKELGKGKGKKQDSMNTRLVSKQIGQTI